MSKLRKWMMKEEKESFSSSADAAFKLFGRTIDVRSGGDSGAIEVADSVDAAPCTSQGGSEVVDAAAARLEEVADDLGTPDGTKSDGAEVKVDNDLPAVVGTDATHLVLDFPSSNETPTHNVEKRIVVQVEAEKEHPQEQQQQGSKDQPLRKPDKLVACPRCDSLDTKFCYYNNYNINQPRHFCKSCQRYWTAGGTLRNVLVGAGRRKNKYGGLQPRQGNSENAALTTVRGNYHDNAQQPLPPVSSSSGSSVVIHTLSVKAAQMTRSSVPSQCSPLSVLESPSVRSVSSPRMEGPIKITVPSAFTVHKGVAVAQKASTLSSALKATGADLTPDSVIKVCSKSRTDTLETRDDCASSAVDTPGDSTLPGNLKLAQQTVDAGTWTHPAAPLSFFNGAWPYGYNIGWSGMGLMPSAASFCPPPQAPAMGSGTPVGAQMWSGPPGGVWTGMWAAGMPQPGMAMSAMPFGWNLQQSGWTMPWRPVAHMAVQASMQESDDLFRKRDSPESTDESVAVRDIKIARVEAAGK